MIYIDVFAALCLALVFGDAVLWNLRNKKVIFAYNEAVLFSLFGTLLLLSSLPGSATYLGTVKISQFSTFFMLLFTAGMLAVSSIAYEYADNYGDFAVLSAFALIGMYLVASASSLIMIFLGLELMSIPSVFMSLLSRKRSLEAATKFLIMASLATALVSFAVVLIYGASGSTALAEQNFAVITVFASAIFIAALGFEASLFPFNVLIPDIYQGSSAYVTAMLGGINKKVGFAALIQIVILLFITFRFAFDVLVALAILTMFYGNLVALVQRNFKRMLAYSSISQAGYILIGIATASQLGIYASMFQIFAHMFMFIGLMCIVAWLEKNSRNEIVDMIGLFKENKFMAVCASVLMLSLIGVPLTTGFIGKLLIFVSAVNAGLLFLALIGILNSVISVFYYSRVIFAMFTDKVGARHVQAGAVTISVVAACVLITLAFGIFPNPVMQLASNAAAALFH